MMGMTMALEPPNNMVVAGAFFGLNKVSVQEGQEV